MERETLYTAKTFELRNAQEIGELYQDLRLNFAAYLEDPEWGENGILRFCEFLLKLPNQNCSDHTAAIIFAEHEKLMVEDKPRFMKVLMKTFEKFCEKKATILPMEMTNVIQLVEEFFPDVEVSRLLYALGCILKERPFYSAYITQAKILKKRGGRGFEYEEKQSELGKVHDRFNSAANYETSGNKLWMILLEDIGTFRLPSELRGTIVSSDQKLHRKRAYEASLNEPRTRENEFFKKTLASINESLEEYFNSLNPEEAALHRRNLAYWSSRFASQEVIPEPSDEEILALQRQFGVKLGKA